MKWMMSSVVVLIAAVLSVGVAAQSSSTPAKDDKMGKMTMKDATHTGCIEAGSTKGTFTLKVAADMAMKDMAMKKDATTKDTPTKDAMAPTTMSLTSASVDLSKHLGHKVSVTGSHDKATAPFAVKTLKMVAASCS
jgi:hypothetical protein